MVFGPFWSKTGIHFAHFGLELGMDFEETTGVDVYVYLLSQFQMNTEKERATYDFKVDFKTSFIWCSNFCNDEIIS